MKIILVADDQAEARELIRTVLTHCGYEVVEAVDGEDALLKAAAARPDLIMLDIHMPGPDGFAVCDALRGMPGFASIPIVAMTAGLMNGEREKALESGFSEFLAKPIRIVVLRETIAALFA